MRVLARIARCDFVQGRPLRKASPIVCSLASSRSVQSQFEHAQYSVPFSCRHLLRAWASFTLSKSKYASQYGRSSSSGVGQKQVSTHFTEPSGSSRACAMALSKYFKVNLDIGHFTAANYDAVAFLKEHHAAVTNLHIKDRKRDQGDNVPWGMGNTPIREVLQLLKREKWPIRAYIEYEHRGTAGPVDEVKTCFAYAKQAIA